MMLRGEHNSDSGYAVKGTVPVSVYRGTVPAVTGALIFILTVISTSQISAKVSVQSSVDKKNIIIGDDLNYSVVIKHPEDYTFTEPDFQKVLSNFEIRNQQSKKSIRELEYKYLLTTYTTGEVKINSFLIENTTHPEIVINVNYPKKSAEDTGDIRDVKPPMLPPPDPLTYFLLAVAAGTLIFYAMKKSRTKSNLTQIATPLHDIPPEERARKLLEELLQKKLIEQGHIKEFYIELSNIVRNYLAEKYNIPVIEKTTEELFYSLKKIIDKKRNIDIKNFLDSCDLVKFAKYIPTYKEVSEDLEKAKAIVRQG